MVQKIITAQNDYIEFDKWIKENDCKKLFIVADDSIKYMHEFRTHLITVEKYGTEIVYFCDFTSNPLYESVVNGVEKFRNSYCDGIMAIGGGSAIDVAKCIKLYSGFSDNGLDGKWLKLKITPNFIPFIVMPTTAGTGSEATRYAVIYYGGIKQSVTSESIIPRTVLMDSGTLKTLPLYHKKSTMMDAMCHAMESFWSVNSTDESKEYSKKALHGVLKHMGGYLTNTEEGNAGMLRAAYCAGRAINIAQTTAGHAMCYKITSLFKTAHGHSAALCVRKLFPWMIKNTNKCNDPRGINYLNLTLDELGRVLGCKNAMEGAEKFNNIFESLGLSVPVASAEQLEIMISSVNPERLINFPIPLDTDAICSLYHNILNGERYASRETF